MYGATVSGRPPELAGVSDIVGNLVNILPLRLNVDDAMSTGAWVRHVQERIGELGAFQHSALAQVQRCSRISVGEPLFSTTLTVENYPIDRSMDAPGLGFALSGAKAFDRTVYPFNLTFVPGQVLRLRFTYDSLRLTAADVTRIGEDLATLLRELTAQEPGDRTIGQLLRATAPEAPRHPEAPAAPGDADAPT